MADNGQKTEEPTPKRLRQGAQGRTVPHCAPVRVGHAIPVFVALLQAWGGQWFAELRRLMRQALVAAFSAQPDGALAMEISRYLLVRVLRLLAPAAGVLLLVTLAMQLVATRLGVSLKKLAPDLKRLSPLSQLRELPRQNLPALLRARSHAPAVQHRCIRHHPGQSVRLYGPPFSRGGIRLPAGLRLARHTALESLWRLHAVRRGGPAPATQPLPQRPAHEQAGDARRVQGNAKAIPK